MVLITKNGWLLTEYTSKVLFDQFSGVKDELVEYVSKHNIEREFFSKLSDAAGEYWAVKPRIFIGEYTLYPNGDGIVATDR